MILAGQEYRAGIGLTTVLPTFDWETYSEAGLVRDPITGKWSALPGLSSQQRGLRGCGVRNYVCHPSFRILSLAWDLKDGRGKRWWRPYDPADPVRATHDVAELVDYVRSGGLLEAFKSDFEWTVWNFHCVPQWGWPPLLLDQLRCCQAKSKASGYPPNLKSVGEVLQLPVRKDPAGEKLIKKLTMPRNPTKTNPSIRWTPAAKPADFDAFYQYNGTDIETETEASLRLPDLTPHELRVWLMDQRINTRGMQIDTVAVDNCIAIVEQAREKFHAELRTLTNGFVQKATEVSQTLKWCAARGIHLHELDEDTLTEALARKDYPRDVLRVLRIRQMLAFGSVNKLYRFKAQTSAAGRLHDQYSYYGAHTALWNGQNVQMANLYSGAFKKPAEAQAAMAVIATRSLEYVEYCYGVGSEWAKTHDPMDALEVVASCLRSLVIAPEGSRLISADFSAIQAVVLAAMFGEDWRLEVFRTHGKIYEMTASDITGISFEELLEYRRVNKKHHPTRQTAGKVPELALGFAGWIGAWRQFEEGDPLPDAMVKANILRWRARSPMVVMGWGGQTINKFNRAADGSYAQEQQCLYGLEGAAIAAIQDPDRAYEYRGIWYQMYEDCLYCKPPSGGYIRYHAPRLERSDREWASPWELSITYEGWNTNAKKGRQQSWERMKAYGGIFTQNVDSHMSREIQAHCMLALEDQGYPIVMHTHDENAAERINGHGTIPEYMHIMRSTVLSLPWAYTPDGKPWPIKIPDAWEAQNYGKWED